jgi:hypothetical protein
MTAHFSSRRVLLVAAILAVLALAPPAEGRVRPRAQGAAAGRPSEGPGDTSVLELFRHLLQSLWGGAGSSMDPLGDH